MSKVEPPSEVMSHSIDPRSAQRLWELSEQLLIRRPKPVAPLNPRSPRDPPPSLVRGSCFMLRSVKPQHGSAPARPLGGDHHEHREEDDGAARVLRSGEPLARCHTG
jgi:hypothetical protein